MEHDRKPPLNITRTHPDARDVVITRDGKQVGEGEFYTEVDVMGRWATRYAKKDDGSFMADDDGCFVTEKMYGDFGIEWHKDIYASGGKCSYKPETTHGVPAGNPIWKAMDDAMIEVGDKTYTFHRGDGNLHRGSGYVPHIDIHTQAVIDEAAMRRVQKYASEMWDKISDRARLDSLTKKYLPKTKFSSHTSACEMNNVVGGMCDCAPGTRIEHSIFCDTARYNEAADCNCGKRAEWKHPLADRPEYKRLETQGTKYMPKLTTSAKRLAGDIVSVNRMSDNSSVEKYITGKAKDFDPFDTRTYLNKSLAEAQTDQNFNTRVTLDLRGPKGRRLAEELRRYASLKDGPISSMTDTDFIPSSPMYKRRTY